MTIDGNRWTLGGLEYLGPLDEVYPIVYVDALVVKVRDGGQVRNKACYLVVGVGVDGVKHALGTWVAATEGAKFWMQVCTELRNRGCGTCSSPAATG